MKLTRTDNAVKTYCDTMIQVIEGLKQGWRKTWLTTNGSGRPMNMSGREYSRMNEFYLYMVCEKKGYTYPIFMTFNQCEANSVRVNKGEKSVTVLFWCIRAHEKDGKRDMTIDEYKQLSNAEQGKYETYAVLRSYNVFNIDQTNMQETKPELYKKLTSKYVVPVIAETTDGMYDNMKLNELIAGKWICPVRVKQQSKAYYNEGTDSITLPTKEQFNMGGTAEEIYAGGQEFYSTFLHEATHSTGAEKRLNRFGKCKEEGKAYGREELVAELTAALIGHELGFNTSVEKNNAAYLSSWLKQCKEQPRFLISVLADVSKAADIIEKAIDAA